MGRPLAPLADGRAHLLGIDPDVVAIGQGVPTRSGDDQRRRAERATRPMDQHVEVRIRICRQAIPPQGIGQHIARHEAAPLDGKETDDKACQAPIEGGRADLMAVSPDLETAEQPDLERWVTHGNPSGLGSGVGFGATLRIVGIATPLERRCVRTEGLGRILSSRLEEPAPERRSRLRRIGYSRVGPRPKEGGTAT